MSKIDLTFGDNEIAEKGLENFSEKEMAQIRTVAEKIDLSNTNAVISFGASAQRKVSDFADGALESVRNKDFGEVGEILSSLIVETGRISEEKNGLYYKLFNNGEKRLEEIKVQFNSTESNIDKLVDVLEKHQDQLVRDIAMLDILYEKNKAYFKEISMYIQAGKMKIGNARNIELPALEEKAKLSGAAEDAQEAQDYVALIDRFEKKYMIWNYQERYVYKLHLR